MVRGVRDGRGTVIKAAFFDVDGTLMSFKTHDVPESARRALAALRERGVRVFVCTGRSYDMLPEAVTTGFDGYVTLNGQVCFDAQGEFRRQRIDPEGVRLVVEQARAGLFEVLFITEEGTFITGHSQRVIDNERKVGLLYEDDDPARALESHVIQMCAFVDPEDEHVVTDENPFVFTARWCEEFCDVMPKGGGKPAGVRVMCERFGLTPEEAVAFGDGGNDVSMLECAGVSVAMGNATDAVKAVADYVTDDVDSDGIWNACAHLGLVG